MKVFAPQEIQIFTREAFTDPDHGAYGQLATVDINGFPQVRTVHFHYVESVDALAFNCHVQSTKWADIQKSGVAAGCYYDRKRDIQFRFESTAELISPDDLAHQKLLEEMWLKMRDEVRLAYWLDHHEVPIDSKPDSHIDLSSCAPNRGVLFLRPRLWDIMILDSQNYRNGQRTIYTFENNKWRSRNSSLIGNDSG